jgi:hypothetical protein
MPRNPSKKKRAEMVPVEVAPKEGREPRGLIAVPFKVMASMIASEVAASLEKGRATDAASGNAPEPQTTRSDRGKAISAPLLAPLDAVPVETTASLVKRIGDLTGKLCARAAQFERGLVGGGPEETLEPPSPGLRGDLEWIGRALELTHAILSRVSDYTGIEA